MNSSLSIKISFDLMDNLYFFQIQLKKEFRPSNSTWKSKFIKSIFDSIFEFQVIKCLTIQGLNNSK